MVAYKILLAFIFVANLPGSMWATQQSPSSGALTAKQAQKAEAEAKTAADHLRLAAYYRSKALRLQRELAEAEELVNYWGQKAWMVHSTKVPNPYTMARSRASFYRLELEKASKRAADHQRTADSLQSLQPQ